MKKTVIPIVLALAVSCTGTVLNTEPGDYDFNRGWKFCICDSTANLQTPHEVFDKNEGMEVPYGCSLPLPEDGPSLLALSLGPADSPGLAEPGFDDSGWRELDLPHDWAIEGDFNRNNPSGTNGGALPGGIGWYRKTFFVPRKMQGRQVRLDFDGVYMNSTVWLNGQELGTRPYGYISFSYDLTPHLQPGKMNTVAVRVDNSDQPNSRWYSGCGIFRNVRLSVKDAVHIAQWGIFAETASTDEMAVNISLEADEDAGIEVAVRLIDSTGAVVSSARSCPDSLMDCRIVLPLENVSVWSPGHPYLYSLETEVTVGGKPVDSRRTAVGIRTISFSPEKGLVLNGIPTKIRGVCLHHDLGCLGSAVNKSAIRRQLALMKDMGANAVRCSHNPPAPELLDLCDEMGLMVMDEAFDMWRQRKTERDYARFFEEWHERDLRDLVIRDRNHPCIIMWSIGNEVLEQWSNASADTLSVEQANFILNFGHSPDQLAKEKEMSVNSLLAAKLAGTVHALDPTRPVTSGCNEPDPGNHLFRSGALDIIGYNYHDTWFASVPENFPGKPFVVSESVSSLMTRGCYRMPSDSVRVCPPLWEDPHIDPTFECSSYDNCHVPWGCTHEQSLLAVENGNFISGQFIWTGFDYLGEPIPFGWPARSSYFGIVDLAGFPKDIYYLYQSVWRDDIDVLHLFPHWNWTAGTLVDVWAYCNNADSVELFLNGKSCGVRNRSDSGYHCSWQVPFSPGELKAVSYKNGKQVCERIVRTASEPACLRLTPDRREIVGDGYDTVFITVEVVDAGGNICPRADNDIFFSINGPGLIAGVDNGSPISLERFKADHRRAFNGKCLIAVRNSGKAGMIEVTAESAPDGISGKCCIPVREGE
ncbi:MAG: glycoside hydrolase family 2 TIM barrel-domain containing protein [Candidatus Cryptobacteroides sp.]